MNLKRILAVVLIFSFCGFIFAQTEEAPSLISNEHVADKSQANVSVDVDDEIYDILLNARTKGYCKPLSNYKPYTESYILQVLEEIEDSLSKLNSDKYWVRTEKEIIQQQKKRFIHVVKGLDINNLEYSATSPVKGFPATMFFQSEVDFFGSGGIYDRTENDAFGFDLYYYLNIFGKISSFLNYRTKAYLGFSDMPITQVGNDYVIGYWWRDTDFEPVTGPNPNGGDYPPARTINTFKNYTVLPYLYKKPWCGSVYYLSNMTASGLEGWPVELSLAFGMEGEITASFFNDNLLIRFGRYSHDLASMDKNSSLVLNSMAFPFLGFDMHIKLTDFFSFDTVTGWMEFPNQAYINRNAFYDPSTSNNTDSHDRGDEWYFQNLYTVKSMNFDFKYFHFDLGSSCIYPKRFELGYMFPLIDCVIYQNSLGDFDNLGLFTNLKGILPGVGYIWLSGFLDEMNKPNAKFWERTRCMLAYQGGIRTVIPSLPFGNLSFRYTKVEPYCYTHTLLAYHPYTDNYAAESYTNNGACLGYYMPPNSDEFLLDFNFKPSKESSLGLSYQLARHGTDWGSGSVIGSNLYSELTYGGRDKLRKYFLYDGTYEWTSTVNLYGEYSFTQLPFPLKINASIAYIYDWFTGVENNGQKNDSFKYISTDEYKPYGGVILSLGLKLFEK